MIYSICGLKMGQCRQLIKFTAIPSKYLIPQKLHIAKHKSPNAKLNITILLVSSTFELALLASSLAQL